MLFLAEALGPRFIDEQFKADSSSAYVTTMHSAFGRWNTVKMAGLKYKGREDIEKKREDAVQRLLHQDLPSASLASAASEKFFSGLFQLRRISRGGARSSAQSPTSSATDRVISLNSEDWPGFDLGSTSRIKQRQGPCPDFS